jgi:hypothetical protein
MKKTVIKMMLVATVIAFFATGCYVERPGYERHYHHHYYHGGGYNRY